MLPDPGGFYPLFHLRRQEVARRLLAPGGTKSLDVGCGLGFLKSIGMTRAVGLDIEITPGVAVRASAEKLPFRDEAFDLVFAGEVLEHLNGPSAALLEWKRVLRIGGKLVISTPNGFLVPLEGNRPDHKHVFSASDLRKSLLELGLTKVTLKAIGLGFVSGRFLFRILPSMSLKMIVLRFPIPAFLSYDLFLSGVKVAS